MKKSKIILTAESEFKDEELREIVEHMWHKVEYLSKRISELSLELKRTRKEFYGGKKK